MDMQKFINKKRYSLAPEVRKEITATLKQTVAELFRLLAGIRNVHRRSRGAASAQLDLFAGQIMGHIDYVSERATAIGIPSARHKSASGTSIASLLHDYKATTDADSVCTGENLADLHHAASRNVRNAVRHLINAQDFGSADMLADVLRTLNRHTPLLCSRGNYKELMMN